ncbi:MAG: glycosyltransferase family 2 protein [Rubricoccaceae bacterium]|nr:glycosyltransferase family 2 protein [Rubricoccaceae bacterium]
MLVPVPRLSSGAPRVSVIIVTWNGRALLERFLPSVLATDYPDFEVVVADNASTDGTAEWLAEAHPEVLLVQHPHNWLFARGNNAAVPHATGHHLVFLNNDVEVPPGWLRPLVATLEALPDAAAVQPKLLQHADRTRFEYAGGAGGYLDALGYPFTRGRLFFTLEEDRGQYDDARDVFWASGACLAVRRKAFEAVGGFDEAFGMHMEEVDLCWRLWRAGWRVRVAPQSEVYHLGGASLPQGDPRKTYLNFRNSLVMLYKNLPPRVWRRVARARRALDGLAWVRALATGGRGEAAAVRRAYRDARALYPLYRDERPADDDSPVLPPYRGAVVLDYYARRRRRFRDLLVRRFHPRWR